VVEHYLESLEGCFITLSLALGRITVLICCTERHAVEEAPNKKDEENGPLSTKKRKTTAVNKKDAAKKSALVKKKAKTVSTPSLANMDDEDEGDLRMPDFSAEEGGNVTAADSAAGKGAVSARQSRRVSRKNYAEIGGVTDED
jgi:hypothetical protein